jgi:hypothetical protein
MDDEGLNCEGFDLVTILMLMHLVGSKFSQHNRPGCIQTHAKLQRAIRG